MNPGRTHEGILRYLRAHLYKGSMDPTNLYIHFATRFAYNKSSVGWLRRQDKNNRFSFYRIGKCCDSLGLEIDFSQSICILRLVRLNIKLVLVHLKITRVWPDSSSGAMAREAASQTWNLAV